MAANSRHNFEFSSWYNTQWTQKWLVPWAFMTYMSCIGPQLLETAERLIITIEHFS